MSFVPVARIDEVPDGRGLRVRVDGVDLGLYRVDGQIFAMEDTCPHAGSPLSNGELEGCVVVCEAHGWPFDVTTGRPPDVPASAEPLARYAVRVVDSQVEIHLDETLP